MLGVPYQEGFDSKAVASYMTDAQLIVDELKLAGVDIKPTKEVIAVIAYLHKLGRDIAPAPVKALPATNVPVTPATNAPAVPATNVPATPETTPAAITPVK